MPELLVGVDIGTYSTKGVVVDSSGALVATASTPHDIDTPRPGWVEQDADDVWWHGLCTVTKKLMESENVDASKVVGVGVSAIGPCMLPLDADSNPLRPGILYGVDTRAHREIDTIEASIGADRILSWSRMEFSSQAVGPKIMWYRRSEPDLWKQTTSVATASSHLVNRLTGRLVIDHHQAAHFIPLYDPSSGTWSDRYADDICPVDMLPELCWPSDRVGQVTKEAAHATRLPEGIPVVAGTVDALSEAVSVGAVEPGDLMIMYGSTAFFILTTKEPIIEPPLWSLPGVFPETNVLAAGMATSGALTRWIVDLSSPPKEVTDPTEEYARLFAEASELAPGAEGLLMLPYFSGERTPINDPFARGVIAGLSLAHRQPHLFRAALEGVAYGIRHNIETLDPRESRIKRCIAVGGGTKGELWLQIVSDVTNRTQLVPKHTIGASRGDAFLAGVGTGLVDVGDLDTWAPHDQTVSPDPETVSFYNVRYPQFLELYTTTRNIVHSLVGR